METIKGNKPTYRNRITRRLFKHHLPLFVLSVVSVWLVYWEVGTEDKISRLSMATAYPGLALLAATLLIGPFKVIRRRPNPVSDDLTRDIGIWAGIVGLAHVILGLQVHMRGRMWLLFLNENQELPFIRLDQFGAANYTGLIATLILAMLLVTSNDWSLRKLGTKQWKRLHYWNYGLFLMVLLHGIIYQIIEKRVLPYPYIFSAFAAIVIIMQLVGYTIRKSQKPKA
ncbi:MAG: ferric reductase-like transmembrane domain-containing protein [Bacteroidetes bacterium]|nr:ferric reductase-like transmembrane domain-containing protein [Bacteroidota bacterium]MDA1121468.1 ferric reductase-like transmembrane domain-containing protein [Bacteroidota bacterium]